MYNYKYATKYRKAENIMKITEKEYGDSVRLGIIDTKKFKTDYFTLCYNVPMTKRNISLASLLAFVISRGTAKHKTLLDINRHLVSLYDADVLVFISKTSTGLTFRITASMLDSVYALDGCDVFGGTLDFIKEMLFSPLASDGKLNAEYTESEKKRAIDRIKAEINNKDRYALKRANEIAYEGTPLALSENGSYDEIEAATPEELYKMLCYITSECPALAAFSGNLTEAKSEALDDFLSFIANSSKAHLGEFKIIDVPAFDKPITTTEAVYAKQGRMVLNYSIPKYSPTDAAPMLFDEIFGASPISRLFTNVRERLSLCYYCSSSCVLPLGRIIVRSGLDVDNKDKAVKEIERQIKLLSTPENISDEELEAARLSRISIYKALSDSGMRYADWYISRRLMGASFDVEELLASINSVTKEEISEVARKMKLQLCYFLEGNEK